MTTSPPEPLVSILMPSTARNTLSQALESVYQQTYTNWECLLGLNNLHLGDNTTLDIETEKVRLFDLGNLPQDSGTTARMKLLAEAKGEYIATLDDDDFWEPFFLSLMLSFLQREKADFAYCGSSLISKKTEGILGYWTAPFDAERLGWGNFILSNTILAKRAAWEAVPLRPEAGYNSDWDWYVRVARAGFKIAFNPHILSNARVKEGVWNYWGPGFEPFSKEEDHTWIAS